MIDMSEIYSTEKSATAFILPLAIFLVIASFYPDFSGFAEQTPKSGISATSWYIGLVVCQVLIGSGLLVYFHRIYLLHFPLRWSWMSILVGAAGVVVWIELIEWNLEDLLLEFVGLKSWLGNRPAFNPFKSIADDGFRGFFLSIRFALLALLVPIVEELFLRGWLVRWMHDPNWEPVTLDHRLSWIALLTPSIYGVLTHPSEAFAAIAWFGLVTWLMVRTGNLWDCVVAHAVTNLLLGIYVVKFSAWQLW